MPRYNFIYLKVPLSTYVILIKVFLNNNKNKSRYLYYFIYYLFVIYPNNIYNLSIILFIVVLLYK